MKNPLRRLYFLLCIPYICLVLRFWSLAEDAYITFRYSRNLAQGLGPRFNLGDHTPVEGYSNFLWMLIAAAFEYLGMDVTFWMPIISFASGLWLLWLVLHTLHVRLDMSLMVTAMAGAAFALFTPIVVWSTSGLATMPQSALMFAAFVWLAYGEGRREAVLAGTFALLLALVRTEGIAWAMVMAGCATASRVLRAKPLKQTLAGYFGVLLTGFALYFAWRYSYYEQLFSNTAHAKVDLSGQSIARGIQYVSYYGLLMVSPLVLVPASFVATFGQRRNHGLAFAAMAVGVPTYALVVSGDYMAYFRMMVPGVAFMVVTLAFFYEWALERYRNQLPLITSLATSVVLLGMLPGFNILLAPERLVNAVTTRLIHLRVLQRILDKDGLDVDRDTRLFGLGAPVHLPQARNEYRQWEKMKANPVKWKVEAEAILKAAKPEDRLVTGTIGSFGYYSNLYIFDQNGLIDGNVSTREVPKLLWPGHDKYVEKTHFLKEKPEILEHKVIFGPDAAGQIERIGSNWNVRSTRDWYYPEVKRVQVDSPKRPAFVVLQRRAESPKQAAEGWRSFNQKWRRPRASERRSGGGHKSTPELEGAITTSLPGGRWRTFTDQADLSESALEELSLLEAIGYVSGSVKATDPKSGVTIHDPERTQPGHMLYTSGHSPTAVLTDINGNVKHRWKYRFNDIWPDYPVEKEHPGRRFWRRAYLLPHGKLLAIHEGLGLVMLNKRSKLLWETANRSHHDLDIAKNGDIFVLTRVAHIVDWFDSDKPVLEDFVTVLDSGGQEKYSISILEAFERSDFDDVWRPKYQGKDVFHTNSIKILDGRIANRIPAFKKGNLLLSMRGISGLAVLDIDQKKIVWAVNGDFEVQHDSKILETGSMLIFNNSESKYSTVMEVDPVTMETVWAFEGSPEQPFKSETCGLADRLPNGNTLIVESDRGRTFEVTPTGEIVWEFRSPHRAGPDNEYVATLLQATRLIDADLSWLNDVGKKGEGETQSTSPKGPRGQPDD